MVYPLTPPPAREPPVFDRYQTLWGSALLIQAMAVLSGLSYYVALVDMCDVVTHALPACNLSREIPNHD
jgi:hypothetical protein